MIKIKKNLRYKYLSFRYNIQPEELNIAGDIYFNEIGKKVYPEHVLNLLNIEFSKIKMKVEINA